MLLSRRSKIDRLYARLALDLLLLASFFFCSLACGSDPREAQENAVALVKELGGSMVRDVQQVG